MTRKIVINLLTAFVVFLFVFPLLWILFSSLKESSQLFKVPMEIFPSKPTIENYINAWKVTDFLLYFKNTTVVTVVATVLTVIISTLCGYSLAKYKFKWLNVVFMCILATTMLPTEVIMTSEMEVVRKLGLYDSLWGIIIPVLSTPTGVFMMRQYFLTVPNEIIESARMDGATEMQIFIRLMIPIAKPIIAALAIFSIRWRWNDYIWPLIVLNDPEKYTLQVALRNIVGENNVEWSLLLASSMLSMIPMIIVFVIFQKQILGADLTSGLKG